MSPNPGEEGHSERGWTHAICADCWAARHSATPAALRDDESVPCCFCGLATDAGIYVRANPAAVHPGATA